MTLQQQAHKAYLKGLKYKEIAEKFGVSINTVKSWQRRYKWSREKGAPKNDGVHPRKGGAQPGSKHALYCGAPKGNKNAMKHGLLSKYIPEEIMGIVADIEDASPLDILWQNILIQHAKIIHAQRVLFVKSNEAHLEYQEKQTSMTMKADGGTEKSITNTNHLVLAQEIESKGLGALSRAMGTLNKMIKQYDELCRSHLATDEQIARIEKIKSDVARNAVSDDKQSVDMSGYVDALNATVNDTWETEDDD